MQEFAALIRIRRSIRLLLFGFAAIWFLQSLQLLIANRSRLGGVPTLNPSHVRMAMPQQDYWDNYRYTGADGQPPPRQDILAMGRGLVRLDDSGRVLWEASAGDGARVAQRVNGSTALRSIAAQPGSSAAASVVTAWSEDGRQLWQSSVDIAADCSARVDRDGTLLLMQLGSGMAQSMQFTPNGQIITGGGTDSDRIIYLDASGRQIEGMPSPDLNLYAQFAGQAGNMLADGSVFGVVGGRIMVWSAMLDSAWQYEPANPLYGVGTDGEHLICLDTLGMLHCLSRSGAELWSTSLPAGMQLPGYGGYGNGALAIEPLGEGMLLHFSTSEWVLFDGNHSARYAGLAYPYGGYGEQPGIFHEGPDGQRAFLTGSGDVVCLDSGLTELWREKGDSSLELIGSDAASLILHDRSGALYALDWDGREIWHESYDWQAMGVDSVQYNETIICYRTGNGRLVCLGRDGQPRFSLQLEQTDQIDLAEHGEHIYVFNSGTPAYNYDGSLAYLLACLRLDSSSSVDCLDGNGRRLWRARLPRGMSVMQLQHRADGGISVLASRDYGSYGYYGGGYYDEGNEWEFVFRFGEGAAAESSSS